MLRALCSHNGSIRHISGLDELEAEMKDAKKQIWMDIDKPTPDEFEFLEKKLGLHSLVLEDMAHERQRPKVEPYDDHLYVVVKVFQNGNTGQTAQLNMVLGANYFLTSRYKPMPFLEEVWERAGKNNGLLSRGADFALYSLLDAFVDNLFPLINQIDLELDDVSEKVFKDSSPDVMSRLFSLKRRLFNTRKAIVPLRDVLTTLSRHDSTLISKKNAVYFRDVYDHMIRIIESLDNDREATSSAMEGYLTGVSNNLNIIMKKLTAITAIIMVPSLIAGIYGMNFANISDYALGGAQVAFAIMALSVMGLGIYFKGRGWL
ncbi:magnesium/cobalt transporter CorA [Candidatus Micrarchaeota archaeon]|nr:magnesium/cobalt transporter CorA [Candidatus Micrarchaeota archaeon]